jgi:hypothetical protein
VDAEALTIVDAARRLALRKASPTSTLQHSA